MSLIKLILSNIWLQVEKSLKTLGLLVKNRKTNFYKYIMIVIMMEPWHKMSKSMLDMFQGVDSSIV